VLVRDTCSSRRSRNSWNYKSADFKQCINFNTGVRLYKFNIDIGFMVLHLKVFTFSSYGSVLILHSVILNACSLQGFSKRVPRATYNPSMCFVRSAYFLYTVPTMPVFLLKNISLISENVLLMSWLSTWDVHATAWLRTSNQGLGWESSFLR
jgi:hypothetical protein